jgi:organic radical activating enzyme
MSMFDPLPQNKTLSIMPTFQCTAACRHCGTISSPRENTWLSLEYIISAIRQAACQGYKVVVFTGGEPTLAGDDLLVGIQTAASCGLTVRMVTNAHWATEDSIAAQYIEKLVDAGLNEINYSTGDQHARFVPITNIIRATRVATGAGLMVAIMIETVKDRVITRATLEEDTRFQQILRDVPTAIIKIHESPWMPLGPKRVNHYTDGMAVNSKNLPLCKGCDSVLSTTTVQADGSIGACCGLGMRLIPELQIGHISGTSLAQADKAAADDFLKRWIRAEGPEKILAWAASHDCTIEWENMYAHRCQACLRLYKDPKVRAVIAKDHTEKLVDVMFAEWLLYHYEQTTAASYL